MAGQPKGSGSGGGGRERSRVVQVVTRLNVGGPAFHVLSLERDLAARGFEVCVASGALGRGERGVEQVLGLSPTSGLRVAGLQPEVSPIGDLRATIDLFGLLRRFQPAVIHTHTSKAGLAGRLAAGWFNAGRAVERRCLVVHTFHGHVMEAYFGGFASRGVQALERVLARCSDTLVAISPALAEDIGRRLGPAAARRTVVVPVARDLGPFLAVGRRRFERLPPNGQEIEVCFAGRLVPVKDLETMIGGFAHALSRVPRLRLRLVGDGPCRGALAGLTARLGLSDRVSFEGWRRDMPAVCAAASIGVLTSLNEGTPIVLMEQMASGLAVVSTAVGGVADVVSHDQTGLLVPPRSPALVGEAVAALAVDRSRRARLGEAAMRAMERRPGPAHVADMLADLYRGRVPQPQVRRG